MRALDLLKVYRLPQLLVLVLWRTFFWTYERGTWQYDLYCIAILTFIFATPPAWLGDPLYVTPFKLAAIWP